MKTYRDHYFKRAKAENYPARSVYKLQEIQKRFNVLGRGGSVLDLGAAPGSWTLFAAKTAAHVLAADIQDPANLTTSFPPNVTFVQQDVFEQSDEFKALLAQHGPFDAVISDMAPKTTGIKFTDQTRSAQLCEQALWVADEHLKPGGNFIAKIFEGPDSQEFSRQMKERFTKVKHFKPKSSRDESRETFVVGMGHKKTEQS